MSIYGPVTTTLQLYGLPGKPIGLQYWRNIVPLVFNLQVGGPAFNPNVVNVPQFCQDTNDGIQLLVYLVDQYGNLVNISAAESMKLYFQRPDGTTFFRTPTFLTNGYDGAVYYTSSDTDFQQDGIWQVQFYFLLAGYNQTTNWGSFTVNPNIINLP